MTKARKSIDLEPTAAPPGDTCATSQQLLKHLVHSCGRDLHSATEQNWFESVAYTLRDELSERWVATVARYRQRKPKRVYYLSLEFLIGRALSNAALALSSRENLAHSVQELGQRLEAIEQHEIDAALGNGGLGRLAACFLDSMATMGIPGMGYGIRYEHGMFYQKIEDGQQVEYPDNWLQSGNPWEFPRTERIYPVQFYGQVVQHTEAGGRVKHVWHNQQTVMAVGFDMPVPGYGTNTVNNLRLWAARATHEFNLASFNSGDYLGAVEEKSLTENISKVLYPNDVSVLGRELRLKQQYFFVSASIQDILRRYLQHHDNFDQLPDKIVIQLNDTHPAIAVAELMYVLLDRYHLEWGNAWNLTQHIFAYTNHTLMPEALETWPVDMFERLLPRHLQIIYEINHQFLDMVHRAFPGDVSLLKRLSIVDEDHGRAVRMAHLAVVGSYVVNGVAELHSQLLKTTLFADFYKIFPEKFINVTNGITPRRWLNQCNPGLAGLIAEGIGPGFVRDLSQIRNLANYADDVAYCERFDAVKRKNKERLAERIQHKTGIVVDPGSLFDVQIKRIHEYKRQLLNVLHVVTLYNRIRAGLNVSVPRTVIFAGKAAPGYWIAKLIIRLIHDVANTVNHDPATRDALKVVFFPNYDVSSAELIFPASDLSEQISTAGTEASGTGNMKMALNGALTIGTLDGANIEIRQEVGEDNFFLFGLTIGEVHDLRSSGYNPEAYYQENAELRQALDMIASGYFSPGEPSRYVEIYQGLVWYGDTYMLLADYASYVQCQERVSAQYADRAGWSRKALLNVAAMGKFSSDRTIQEYAERIWRVAPCTA